MAKRERPEVKVGQIWCDRDKRMFSGERKVRVEIVAGVTDSGTDKAEVYYRHYLPNGSCVGQQYRSRYQRFQRAFALDCQQSRASGVMSPDDMCGW